MASSPAVQLIGRRSSHFTRVAALYAHALAVPFELVVVHDITSVDPAAYGGHPALKIPTLRVGASVVFGTENICRRLAELAGRSCDTRLVWPEQLTDDLARSAQELTWHAMSAQVQLVMGTVIGQLPADSVFFAKGRAGLLGALAWLEEHVARVVETLPHPRDLSLLEVALFCLVEHLAFRPTVPMEPYPALRRFAAEFATRPAALSTGFRFDARP